MVELMQTIKSLLTNNNQSQEVLLLKIFASEVWRLNMLPEQPIDEDLQNLLDDLNTLFQEIHQYIQNNQIDVMVTKLVQAKALFFKYYLAPLNLENIEKFIEEPEDTFNAKLVTVFKKAVCEKFFDPNENLISWNTGFTQVEKFLELYGFKQTHYIKKLILSYINFKQADINNFQDKLQQSMTAKISSKFTNFTGNSISVKKATEIMLETLCQNPEIGDPFSLTLRLLDCFEGVTLQIVSFIDSILARVFKNIELFLFHSKINSICFAYEEKIEKLDSALLSIRNCC